MMILIGGAGTDGGGYIIVNGKLKKIPGWNPEELSELSHAVRALSAVSRMKTPGLADNIASEISTFVAKEVARHAPQGADRAGETVVVVMGS
jgi:hypothetical protein